jgi:hypothetical protein
MMVFAANWLAVARGAVRVAAGLSGLWAVLVLIAYRLAVARGAVRVAARFPGTGLFWLRAIMVFVAYRFAVACGAVRVAARLPGTGLFWLRAIMVFVAYRLAVARGAVRVTSGLSGPGWVRLRAIRVFAANWNAVARGAARVAAGYRDYARLGRRLILESGLDVLPCSAEEAACLTQWLLGWFGGTGLNLLEHLLLIPDRLPGLSQEVQHLVVRQLAGQMERLVQVSLQSKQGGLVRHIAG